MKNGWIIYEKADAEINQFFIETVTEYLREKNVGLELVLAEDVRGTVLAEDDGQVAISESQIDFVINRSRDYKLSEFFEKQGIRVFNNSAVTKVGNDKAFCQTCFEKKVRMMPETEEYPQVIKSLAGHGGKEVFLVNSKADEEKLDINFPFIRQAVCSDKGRDKRVYILGNEIVAAVLRTSDDFKSNFSLGGKVELSSVSPEEKQMVDIILNDLSIDYAGIDFIYHNGQPVFNEIEDAVGARMLYNCSEIDIIKMFADYVCVEINSMHD